MGVERSSSMRVWDRMGRRIGVEDKGDVVAAQEVCEVVGEHCQGKAQLRRGDQKSAGATRHPYVWRGETLLHLSDRGTISYVIVYRGKMCRDASMYYGNRCQANGCILLLGCGQ